MSTTTADGPLRAADLLAAAKGSPVMSLREAAPYLDLTPGAAQKRAERDALFGIELIRRGKRKTTLVAVSEVLRVLDSTTA